MQSCQSQRNIWKRSNHKKAFPDLPPLLNGGEKETQRHRLESSSAASNEALVVLAIRGIRHPLTTGCGKSPGEHLPVSRTEARGGIPDCGGVGSPGS